MKNLLILFVLALSISSCKDENKIQGTWTVTEGSELYVPIIGSVVEFKSTEIIIDSYSTNYQLNDNIIYIEQNNEFVYWYSVAELKRNRMKLHSSEDGFSINITLEK